MGQSKASLFLERVIAAAAPAFERVIAVERAGGVTRSIPTIFESPHEDEAPIFGVVRALEETAGPCFILATDYPRITSDVLRMLRRRFEVSNASMLVPMWSEVPQVLCAGYRRCVLPIATERIASRTYDIRGLLDEVDVEYVTFAGDELANINTPEELKTYS